MKRETLTAWLRTTDLYTLLDVSPEATPDDIRRAYRRGALECHPDKHPDDQGAAERFLLLTRARDVLLDVETRAAYDRVRDQKLGDRAPIDDEPILRRRGARKGASKDPLNEHRLADRAARSRSAGELTRLWMLGTVVVRAAILRNPACPLPLFSDPHVASHWMLSLEAANRAQCPPEVLTTLATSFECSVARAVAAHPAAPPDALQIIATRHRDLQVLTALANHPNANGEVLREVGRSVRGPRTAAIGLSVVAHPACPPDLASRIRMRLGSICA